MIMNESSPTGPGTTGGSVDPSAASGKSGRESADAIESKGVEFNTIPVGDLDVILTFELGSKKVSLRNLSTIQPGFCFEMDRSVQCPVVIRANGKTVGEGELIDMEGRVAVRITEMNF